jgi:outer membrane protein
MRRSLFATCLAATLGLATTAAAQSPFDLNAPPVGKQAGTFMIRARGIGVFPLTSSSSISGIGGHVDATNTGAPEVDFSYFLTDNIAVELIAATTKHDISAVNSALGGRTAVGSVWVLPPTLTMQYHFFPHERLSPYVGAGINATFFYGAHAAGAPVTSLGFDNNIGAALQVGMDYNVAGHWFLNADVKQIFLNTTASINGGAIKAKTALNPLVAGAGIGYRF